MALKPWSPVGEVRRNAERLTSLMVRFDAGHITEKELRDMVRITMGNLAYALEKWVKV